MTNDLGSCLSYYPRGCPTARPICLGDGALPRRLGTDYTRSPGSGSLDLRCQGWEVSERGPGRGSEVLRAGTKSEVAGESKNEADTSEAGRTN